MATIAPREDEDETRTATEMSAPTIASGEAGSCSGYDTAPGYGAAFVKTDYGLVPSEVANMGYESNRGNPEPEPFLQRQHPFLFAFVMVWFMCLLFTLLPHTGENQ